MNRKLNGGKDMCRVRNLNNRLAGCCQDDLGSCWEVADGVIYHHIQRGRKDGVVSAEKIFAPIGNLPRKRTAVTAFHVYLMLNLNSDRLFLRTVLPTAAAISAVDMRLRLCALFRFLLTIQKNYGRDI
uniref:Phosphoinositide phospholipase C n=1 Tax=Ascaris lumbricoides TaxID=6252 RepID=A0A0M3HVS6_ASCLU